MSDLKKKKIPKHYVDNKKFLECIIEYKTKLKAARENGTREPLIPDFAGECIQKIAENLAFRFHKFSRYSYRDEMASDAIMNCIKYFDRFDENKYSNPHAYFTMVCFQANVNRIKLEQKNRYIIYKSFEREMIMTEHGEQLMAETSSLLSKEMYDNIGEYIVNYEEKEKARKVKRNEKLQEKKAKDSLELFFVNEEDNEEQ